MTLTAGLSREQVAVELRRMRPALIGATQRDFPPDRVPLADLEDAYGDISLQALQRNFSSVAELARYMHEALRHDALDLVRSKRFRGSSPLSAEARAVAGDGPERAALANEDRDRLYEFIAELGEQDRRLAYLHLDPDHRYAPRQIAAMLGLPRKEVRRTLDRIGIRLRRFEALAAAPGALCVRRRADLLRWQQTGDCPAALERHCRRCPSCRAELRQAREAVRGAILPLIPAGAMPLAAPGAIASAYHAIATHPAVQRANEALVRVRKWAPVGGGGSAAIAAKLAVGGATVVVGAGAAIHAAVDGHRTPPHHRRHRPAVVMHAQIVHVNVITATSTTAVTVPATTAATTTTAVAAPAPTPAATTTTATSRTVTPPPPNQPNPGPSPTAEATTASAATANTPPPPTQAPPSPTGSGGNTGGSSRNTNSAGGGSGTQSGLPAPGGPPPP
ncbi:MAG: sigma-70 family RNA polymerase sigma factor [Solirubrobacteraceae bacterium]